MSNRRTGVVSRWLESSSGWQVALAVFFATLAIYVPTANVLSTDVTGSNVAAWMLATEGTASYDPVIWMDVNEVARERLITPRPDGSFIMIRTAGTVAPSIPAYWLVQPSSRVDWPGDVTAAFLTAISVTLLYSLLSRHLARRRALAATAVFAFTTPVWSVAADGMWPHTTTTLGIVAMGWAADRERWWLVGLFGGVAMWGRPHAAFVCAILGLLLAWRRRDISIAIKTGFTGSLMLGGLMVWNYVVYRTWSPTAFRDPAVYTQENALDILNQLGMWLAPDRGILVWTPVVLVLGAAVVRNWRNLPDWSQALLIGGLVYTFVQAQSSHYFGGDAFWPYRLGLEAVVAATPALALSLDAMGPVAKRILPIAIVAQAAMVLPGAIGLIMMPTVNLERPDHLVLGTTTLALIGICCLLWAWARWSIARQSSKSETIRAVSTS